MKLRSVIALSVLATPGAALDLNLPGGNLTQQIESPADSVRLPRRVWSQGTVFPGVEGAVRRSVYTVLNPSLTTLQLVDPLRQALLDDGYQQVFACADAECGGFDFRFQLDLIAAPDMYVDLGNYRYVLMEKPGAAPHLVGLVASSSASTGYLHVTEVGEAYLPEITGSAPTEGAADRIPVGPSDLIAQLLKSGHAVLSDLEFGTGSSELGVGPFPSLRTLAEWLAENPSAQIVLVGHSDAVGSLEANASLSRRRAQSVLERLTSVLGADRSQMAADGAGALSPIASNLDAEGRAQNRRVEVVLLSLE